MIYFSQVSKFHWHTLWLAKFFPTITLSAVQSSHFWKLVAHKKTKSQIYEIFGIAYDNFEKESNVVFLECDAVTLREKCWTRLLPFCYSQQFVGVRLVDIGVKGLDVGHISSWRTVLWHSSWTEKLETSRGIVDIDNIDLTEKTIEVMIYAVSADELTPWNPCLHMHSFLLFLLKHFVLCFC